MDWKRTAVAAALCVLGAAASAQQTPPPGPPPMGPGMMGGYGQGYGPGHGPGHWRDPRDDDLRCGHGGWGMGPGMMGGFGPGAGLMGGAGWMGFGLGPIDRLDLSESQRKQVLKLQDDLRRKNWDTMGKMQDEMARLRDLMWADKRDRAAILAAYKRISDLRLQMVENALDGRDKADALLTRPQREQLHRFAP